MNKNIQLIFLAWFLEEDVFGFKMEMKLLTLTWIKDHTIWMKGASMQDWSDKFPKN